MAFDETWHAKAFDENEHDAWTAAGTSNAAEARALADLSMVPELCGVDVGGETALAYWRRTADPNVSELAMNWNRRRR